MSVRPWSFVERPKASADAFTIPSATPQQPNYTAASQGRRLRVWRVPQSGPNYSIARDVPVIRARARAAVRNDPWAGAALDKLTANAIATGIKAKMLNGTPEQKTAARKLYDRFLEQIDADGVSDGYAQQALAFQEWREVGEVFGRLRYRRPGDPLAIPLQVQVIEAEQCPNDLFRTEANGNETRAGVEFDRIGRRVAYWMYRDHPGERFTFKSHELVRIPADQIIHLYRPLRAGQIRGIPDHASVLVRMFNLDSMDDAVLEQQKIANMFTAFFEQQNDPEQAPPLVDELSTDEDGVQQTDVDDVPLAGLEPGSSMELPPGYQVKFSSPPAPGTEYAEYLRGHLLAIATRHGVPYEVLTGDLRNVSDRALRLILNEFRRAIEMLQWLYFIPQWCQRIRVAAFDAAWLAGRLDDFLPDYEERRGEYLETLWVPQGWPYSHPVQDVTADIKAIRAGLDSRSAVVLRNGDDPEEVDAQIAEDNERADERGLAFDSDGRKLSSAGLTQARPGGTAIPSTDVGGNQEPDDDEDQDDVTTK